MESITEQKDKAIDRLAEDIQLSAIEPLSIPAALKYIAGRLTEKGLSMLAREIESIAQMIADEPPEDPTDWNILSFRDKQWFLTVKPGLVLNLSAIAASTGWHIKNSIAILNNKTPDMPRTSAAAYMDHVFNDKKEYPITLNRRK